MRIVLIAGAAAMAVASAAHASSLQSFGSTGNLNGYVGTGISDADMVVSTSGDLKIGIKGFERFVGDVANNGVDTFYAQPGFSAFAPSGSATWNYVFAVDAGTNALSNYNVKLLVDFDPSAGTSFVEADYSSFLGASSKFGDSQNLAFNFWSSLPGYQAFNAFAPGKYDFVLNVAPKSNPNNVLSSAMSVVVVPLPAAVWAGMALLGAAGVGRFARKSIA
jgi:hypothetical protein